MIYQSRSTDSRGPGSVGTGAMGGARDGGSRHSRMARVTTGVWIAARICIPPPQPGHSRTSTANKRQGGPSPVDARDAIPGRLHHPRRPAGRIGGAPPSRRERGESEPSRMIGLLAGPRFQGAPSSSHFEPRPAPQWPPRYRSRGLRAAPHWPALASRVATPELAAGVTR